MAVHALERDKNTIAIAIGMTYLRNMGGADGEGGGRGGGGNKGGLSEAGANR